MHTVKSDNMYHGLVALCNVFVLLCRDTPSNHLFGGMAIASHGRAFDEVFSASLESQISLSLPRPSPLSPDTAVDELSRLRGPTCKSSAQVLHGEPAVASPLLGKIPISSMCTPNAEIEIDPAPGLTTVNSITQVAHE